MRLDEHTLDALDDAAIEIASILALGYMRYSKSRMFAQEGEASPEDAARFAESEAVTEKRLDCSGQMMVRS